MFGCCLIPCFLKECLDVQHHCSSCKSYLGRFKRFDWSSWQKIKISICSLRIFCNILMMTRALKNNFANLIYWGMNLMAAVDDSISHNRLWNLLWEEAADSKNSRLSCPSALFSLSCPFLLAQPAAVAV